MSQYLQVHKRRQACQCAGHCSCSRGAQKPSYLCTGCGKGSRNLMEHMQHLQNGCKNLVNRSQSS